MPCHSSSGGRRDDSAGYDSLAALAGDPRAVGAEGQGEGDQGGAAGGGGQQQQQGHGGNREASCTAHGVGVCRLEGLRRLGVGTLHNKQSPSCIPLPY